MLSVNMPYGRINASGQQSIVSSTTSFTSNPGDELGLSYDDITRTPLLTTNTVPLISTTGSSSGEPTATYLSDGPNGVDTSPGAPTLPLEIDDVGIGGGNVLRGVGFLGGSYTDTAGITPLTGAPGTELSGVHSTFSSSAFYPSRLWSVNYFNGLTDANGDPTDAELMLTPAQYESDAPGSLTDTQRAYSSVSLRLFYDGDTQSYGANTPALAAPPTIARVDASSSLGTTVTFQAHVVGDPSAGIQQVWVTYTGVDSGKWESLVPHPGRGRLDALDRFAERARRARRSRTCGSWCRPSTASGSSRSTTTRAATTRSTRSRRRSRTPTSR